MDTLTKGSSRRNSSPRLDDWYLTIENDPFKAPEQQTTFAAGAVSNHTNSKFKDGKHIVTSRVIELNVEDKFLRTRNTRYDLGEPKEEWLEWLKENSYKLQSIKPPRK